MQLTPIKQRDNDSPQSLTEYFANENCIIFDEETQPLVKNKGTFHSPRNQNKTLDIVAD